MALQKHLQVHSNLALHDTTGVHKLAGVKSPITDVRLVAWLQ